jgi:sugar phosphate permease
MNEKSELLGRQRPQFNEEKLAKYRNFVYYLTFVAYAMSHFSRKSYTNVKVQMKGEAGMDPILLSQMDTAFMFFYAIGSFFSGRLGDTFHAPTIIGLGLFGSSICVFLLVFGIYEDYAKTSAVGFTYFYFLITWTIHGLFQSTGGPVRFSLFLPLTLIGWYSHHGKLVRFEKSWLDLWDLDMSSVSW